MAAKKKVPKKDEPTPIVDLKGGLVWAGNDMFPRPGKVNFKIVGAEDIFLRLVPISINVFNMDAITGKHVIGEISIKIFEKFPDNKEYAKDIADQNAVLIKRKNAKPKK